METGTKHSEGPWQVTGLSKHGPYIKVRGTKLGGAFEIANCPFTVSAGRFYGVEEAQARARLIAAAPDMLDVLKSLQLSLRGMVHANESDWFVLWHERASKIISEVVAKAEGA